ncbi:MAG: 16S rRNA (guanine(527)-N(7))-methyltransferase RsmG [Clostridia bacterium]|nr:16S rRNA (guanine(527)-N(7))-methyltransferase RsmG [Clostridia bacterium]
MDKLDFKNSAKNLGINLSNKMLDQFEHYYNKLIKYNQKVNLTAITEKEDVYIKHFLDSIVTAKLIKKNATLCDIGCGAGFPSLPLKIVRPDLYIIMVDSLNKRIIFLNELVSELGLSDVESIHARAEDFAKTHRESFDYAVARAVAGLNTLSEYCLPFVKVGGQFLAYKAHNLTDELNESKKAIKILGGEFDSIYKVVLPQTEIERNIVIINKRNITPKAYPRDKNKAKIQPL